MRHKSLWILLALLLAACETDQPTAPVLDEPGPPPATQSFRVLALGNSLMAGFMNNGLAAPGQVASFPNLIARQIWPSALLGPRPQIAPGVYLQMPLMAYDYASGVRGISSTAGKGSLYVNASGQITQDDLVVAPTDPAFASSYLLNARLPHPYDNLGIPGAFSLDVPTTTDATNSTVLGNAFFDLILRPGLLPAITQLAQFEMAAGGIMVVGQDEDGGAIYGSVPPMLATIWIGNNDILLGATSGEPATGGNMTPSAIFEATLTAILDAVEQQGIPMVALANIPDITAIPFFTAVPNEAQPGVPWTTDESNVELVTLNARRLPGFPADYTPAGSSSLPDSVTLTTDEVAEVTALVQAYNGIISVQASARMWALVDINAALNNLQNNPSPGLNSFYPWDPGSGTQNLGSAFSLDGIHPGEKGYALIANHFLEAINTHYAANLPQPFPSIDLATVDNLSGFEIAPTKAPAPGRPLFTEAGAKGLWDSTVGGAARF